MPEAAVPAPAVAASVDRPLAGVRILVVDDVAANVALVASALRPNGAKVLGFTDPHRARAAAEREAPDVALLDIQMPGLDGLQLCRWLRAHPGTATVPVIFLTASDRQDDKIRGFDAGGVDHLTKPVDLRELLARVSTHAQMARQRRELEHRNRLLEQAAEFRDQVDAITHHDLKAPLVSVLGFASLLLETADLEPGPRDFVDRIQRAGQHMLQQIDHTLDLVRIEQGRYDGIEARADLHEVLAAVTESQAGAGLERRVSVHRATGPGGVVTADDGLLRRAFENLVKNAVEAAPDGSTVEVRTSADEDTCRVEVANEGEVPAELRDRFFDKYTTAGKRNGTGLGTYSAARIVGAFGGRVELDTTVPGRTRVTVELRRAS